MSLLTSSATTRQNQRFFLKMQKEFMKRSFHNQNYSEPPHRLQQVNDNTEKAEDRIRQQIEYFLDSLKNIIADTHNSRIDYYFVVSQLKNRDFFSEVAGIIESSIVGKNLKLERDNDKLKLQLKKVHQQMREISKQQLKDKDRSNEASRFNGIKTIPENLYAKAKILTEEEFTELYNKVILGDKVVIKKISETEKYKKWDQLKVQKIEEKQIIKRIDAFIEQKNKGKTSVEETELATLIEQLRQNIQRKGDFVCKQPCCQDKPDPAQHASKAHLLRRSTDYRQQSRTYRNNKADQYFNRYYRRSQFDIHNVYSVEKTKLQEMQKLQDVYRVNLKARTKISKSMLK